MKNVTILATKLFVIMVFTTFIGNAGLEYQQLTLMHLDDNPADLKLLQIILRDAIPCDARFRIKLVSVSSYKDVPGVIQRDKPDVVISDFRLGSRLGTDYLPRYKELGIPAVILSSEIVRAQKHLPSGSNAFLKAEVLNPFSPNYCLWLITCLLASCTHAEVC